MSVENVINCSAEVRNVATNQRAGDIDILTDKYFIEVKTSFSDAEAKQMKKYTDRYQEQFMNFEGKKVILYIEKEITEKELNGEEYGNIVGLGVKIINSRKELKELLISEG